MKRVFSVFLAALLMLALLPGAAQAAAQSEQLIYATEPVYLRTGPGIEHDAIVELQLAEAIILQGADGKWAKVRYGGEEGYVFAQYLTDPAHAFGSLYTLKSNASVYARESTGSKRLGRLKKGALVQRSSAGGSWGKIHWGDTFGYVREKYLQRVKPAQGSGTYMIAMGRLNRAGWEKKDFFIEYFVDANQNLAIRAASGADRAKLEKEAKEILGEDIPCCILLSSLPKEYNGAKIAKTTADIGSRVDKLTPAQRELLSLRSWGYSPLEDCFRVGMEVCDEETIANFKKWIGELPNMVFVQESMPVPKT